MDGERINLFQMDISTRVLHVACKLYPILMKYQKLINEEIKIFENAGCISKSLSLLATPVTIVPKKPDPLNPQKQQLHLVLDNQSLNKSINAEHNGNSVISYHLLPNINRSSSTIAEVNHIFLLKVRLPPYKLENRGKAKNYFCQNKW